MAESDRTVHRRVIAAAGLVAAASLVYDPTASAFASKTTVILGLGLLALAITVPKLWRDAEIPRALGLFVALTLWLNLSRQWSDHPAPGVHGMWSGGLALAFAALALPVEARRTLTTYAALIIAGGTAIATTVQGWFGTHMAVHGGHGNPNWCGLVLASSLPLVVHAARQARDRARLWIWSLFGLSLWALALSASRTAWLALAATGALVGLPKRLLIALLAVLAAYAWVTPELWTALTGRVGLWSIALDVAAQHPWFGHGSGNFPFAFLDAQGGVLGQQSLDQAALQFLNAATAHNSWLQILCDGGLVGLCLAAALWAGAVRQLWISFRPGAASLIAIGLCALGDDALGQPAVLTTMCLVLTTGAAPTTSILPRGPARVMGRATLLLLFATAATHLAEQGARWLSERLVRQAVDNAPALQLAHLQRAVVIDPGNGEAWLELGLLQLRRQDFGAAIESLALAREQLANVGTDVALGNAYFESGQTDAAITAYARALAHHPALVAAHLNMAQALRRQRNPTEAQRHAEAVRELLPGHPALARLDEQLRQDGIGRSAAAPR